MPIYMRLLKRFLEMRERAKDIFTIVFAIIFAWGILSIIYRVQCVTFLMPTTTLTPTPAPCQKGDIK